MAFERLYTCIPFRQKLRYNLDIFRYLYAKQLPDDAVRWAENESRTI